MGSFALHKYMINKWDYSGVSEMCFSDKEEKSYKKSAEFLGDSCEDWGCGTGWSKRYFKNYKGIDGSLGYVDKVTDLTKYTSDVDNILMRQVLECNTEWKTILDNVKKSFRKKFCLIIMTPFVEETKLNASYPVVKSDGLITEESIPEIFFKKQDILDCFKGYKLSEETVTTKIGYGSEWILYAEK